MRKRTHRQASCLPIASRVESAELDRRNAGQEAARALLGAYVGPPVPEWPTAFEIPLVPYWEAGPLGVHFSVTDPIWDLIASRLSSRAMPVITEDEGKRLDDDARQYELAGEQWMIYDRQAVPEPYEGDDGYAFMSYARWDLDDLLVVAESLEFLGVNVWWDAAIPGATSWADELVSRIDRSDFFVLLASSRSMASHHVLSELEEAIGTGKALLTLQIEPGVELPADVATSLSASQMLSVWHPDFDRDLARTVRHLQSALG